mgnify:CR=1 FL=1|tara:strand:+ start:1338 stop:1514 length:177 start_codon:yes stop_codon:yes gene_type:complete
MTEDSTPTTEAENPPHISVPIIDAVKIGDSSAVLLLLGDNTVRWAVIEEEADKSADDS